MEGRQEERSVRTKRWAEDPRAGWDGASATFSE